MKYILITSGTMSIVEVPAITLEVMQGAVGGYIECPLVLPLEGNRSASVYCNEEGKIHGLPLNIAFPEAQDAFAGNVIVVGTDENTGESVSLTDEELARIKLVPLTREELSGYRGITMFLIQGLQKLQVC